jgi:hypothetical protein
LRFNRGSHGRRALGIGVDGAKGFRKGAFGAADRAEG